MNEEKKQELIEFLQNIPSEKLKAWNAFVNAQGGTIVINHTDPGAGPHEHDPDD